MLEYQETETERKVTNKTSFQSYFGKDIVVLVYKNVKFITEWTKIFFQKKKNKISHFRKINIFSSAKQEIQNYIDISLDF